jgi:phosphoserine phosphatase
MPTLIAGRPRSADPCSADSRGAESRSAGPVSQGDRGATLATSLAPAPGDESASHLSRADLETVLAVTRALAAPFDLSTMLAAVTSAARDVLRAERSSVWLLDVDAGELVLEVSSDARHIRIPITRGLAGACALERRAINVPDCAADPRFDASVDRASGFRTRCSLTLPLIDHRDVLIGVMQVLNHRDGVFDADDQALAEALAAQCAVALSRVRMTEALVEGERLKQELALARVVQMSTLPTSMPVVAGYDMHATFMPAELTGGDTYDLSTVDQGLLILLGDATGHGIAPALSVTQMQAMLRMAFRLGADLETAFREVNDRLAETLPDSRFITAFVGLLDAASHRLRFLSAGQAPILVFREASGDCEVHGPTSFPLGAMPIVRLRPAVALTLLPGDVLVLLSDGIYEHEDPHGEQFGRARVEQVLRAHRDAGAGDLARHLLAELTSFASGAPQDDDITMVVLKREASAVHHRAFARRIDVLDEVVAFTDMALAGSTLDDARRHAVHFGIEELMTNMIKYAPHGSPCIELSIRAGAGGVEVTLTETGVDAFDPTRASDVRIDQPATERQPGGLGLHLVRKTVDALRYAYIDARREGRTSFRVGTPTGARPC